MKIVEKVKKIMSKQKITIYALSEMSGVSQTGITKWFRGTTKEMSLSSLRKISEVLNIPLAELIVGDGEELRVLDKQGIVLVEQFYMADKEFRESIINVLRTHNKIQKED